MKKNQKIIIVLTVVLGIFLILFRFTDTPMVWVDEGLFTATARSLAENGVLGLQLGPNNFFPMNNFLLSVSYAVIFPVALCLKIFGIGIWQARLTMVIYMFVLALGFYLFAEKKYNFRTAILSVFLLLSFAPFYGNGRPVQGEVPGLAFLVLGSYVLLLWEMSDFKNRKLALIAGVLLGLAASVKPLFLVGVPIAILVAIIFSYKKIKEKKEILFLTIGFILPVAVWISIHIPNWHELINLIPNYIYFSGNHGSSLSAGQTVLKNISRFFTESTPILFLFLILTVCFSLVLKYFRREKLSLSMPEVLFLTFIFFNWLGYLKGTGWYRYFFPAHTLVYLMFSWAIFEISRFSDKNWIKKAIISIPVLLIIFQFVQLIFFSNTSFFSQRTRNQSLAAALSEIKLNQSVLFYGADEAIIFLKSKNYYQYYNMENFLDTGNRNIIENPQTDFILSERANLNLPCYTKTEVSRYDFYRRIPNCKIK